MNAEQIQIVLVMIIYFAVLVYLGIYYSKRAHASSDFYFIGGRTLGPWITAMSAEASDMSGWLLMGLPGLAYWCGLSDAFWTSVGLAAGTYINWLFVAGRLRKYSAQAMNSITIPEFISNRFKEDKDNSGHCLNFYSCLFYCLCRQLLCYLWQAVQHAFRAGLPADHDRRRNYCYFLYTVRRFPGRKRLGLHTGYNNDYCLMRSYCNRY